MVVVHPCQFAADFVRAQLNQIHSKLCNCVIVLNNLSTGYVTHLWMIFLDMSC